MRHSVLALILTLLLPVIAAAKKAGVSRVNADAHSTGWGADYKFQARRIFQRLLFVSNYYDVDDPAVGAERKEAGDPIQLIIVDKFRNIEGSPALALTALTPPNEKPYAIVILAFGAFEFTDEDQLAYIIAHEIGHIAKKDPQAIYAYKMKLFDAWYDKHKKWADKRKPEVVVKRALVKILPKLQKAQIPLERLADDHAELLLSHLPEFDLQAGAKALERAQDWLWALGDSNEDKSHDPLEKRVIYLRQAALHLDGSKASFPLDFPTF